MCNFNIPIPTPRKIAINFLRNHYEGKKLQPIKWYNNMYSGCSHYGVGIGMHVADKNYGNDKIVVEIGMKEDQVYIFNLKEIYEEALQEEIREQLGVKQLSFI